MDNIRAVVDIFLAKVEHLLTTNPVRMIGYGSAVVVFIAAKVLSDAGYTRYDITFEQAMGLTAASVAFVTLVVESARRFVYSPQTYIEDLADQWSRGHAEAHVEQVMSRIEQVIVDHRRQAEAKAPEDVQMPIATVPNGKLN